MSDFPTAREWVPTVSTDRIYSMHQCYCVGPQKGQTLCPCRLRDRFKIMENKVIDPSRPLDNGA